MKKTDLFIIHSLVGHIMTAITQLRDFARNENQEFVEHATGNIMVKLSFALEEYKREDTNENLEYLMDICCKTLKDIEELVTLK